MSTTTSIPTPEGGGPPTAVIPGLPRVGLIGAPESGRETLLKAFAVLGGAQPEANWERLEELPIKIDGILYLLNSTQDRAELSTRLSEFAQLLQPWKKQRGYRCETGGLPVYLVITRCDLLARKDDATLDWLERSESMKHEASRQLTSLLQTDDPDPEFGFGSVNLVIWAIAFQRPALTDQPTRSNKTLGVIELHKQASGEARNFMQRQRTQSKSIRTMCFALIALLLFMCGVGTYWAIQSTSQSDRLKEKEASPSLRASRALEIFKELANFSDYYDGNSFLWGKWGGVLQANMEEMETIAELLSDKDETESKLKHVLVEANRRQQLYRERAAVLGLINDAKLPAPLFFEEGYGKSADLTKLRAALELRVQQLGKFQTLEQPLPPELSSGFLAELHRAIRNNHDKMLTPFRRTILDPVTKQFVRPDRTRDWSELSKNWLAKDANRDLGPLRQLSVVLQRLGGRETPTDPLSELRTFLLAKSFSLPLERVELTVPRGARYVLREGDKEITNEVAKLKLGEKLTIVHRTLGADEQLVETAIHLIATDTNAESRIVFLVPSDNKLIDGRLEVKPGDLVEAHLNVEDGQGRKWRMSWNPELVSSACYTWPVLGQTPVLHTEGANLRKGQYLTATGYKLLFTDPKLFLYPDLFPR